MDNLSWDRPLVLDDYLALLLSMSGPWPPSRPGVYVVTERLWTGRPSVQTGVLYVGGTKNLLDRIGNLIRDVLGFFGEVEGGPGWVGKHSGAQSLWNDLHRRGHRGGDLVLGWAPTSFPCQWCVENELARSLRPTLNRRPGSGKCCCQVAAVQ